MTQAEVSHTATGRKVPKQYDVIKKGRRESLAPDEGGVLDFNDTFYMRKP